MRNPTGTRAWALAGALAGALLSVAAFAPAAWLASAIERASGARVVLADTQGSIWSGSGQLILSAGPGSDVARALPGRVYWSLRPRWLGLAGQLQADCCAQQPISVTLTRRGAGWRTDIAAPPSRWPAAVLAGLGAPWNTLAPQGEITLAADALSVEWSEGRLTVAGSARIEANRISSGLSPLKPMGSYRITLHPEMNPSVAPPTNLSETRAPRLDLETVEGALLLRGQGQWLGSHFRFSGTAEAAPEREAVLSNLLNIIGRRDGPRSIITVG